MQMYDFGGYQTELHPVATKSWYQAHSQWGCTCHDCRNFLEVVKRGLLPQQVIELLNSLEIPPEKATYVCGVYAKDAGMLYQFSYRIEGTILKEPSQEEPAENWGEVRCCHEPYPYGAPNFPEPHFDLEFWVDLPWVLEETI